jgi:hypothetical protein
MADEPSRQERDEATRRAALDDLKRVERDAETVGRSALAHTAKRAVDHFAGKDAVNEAGDGTTDQIELWGRRIGRTLSLIGVIVLAVYLVITYVLR